MRSRPTLRLPALIAAVLAVPAFLAGPAAAQPATHTVKLDVKGMVCPLCEDTVESVVSGLDGVKDVDATYQSESAVVVFDPSVVEAQAIAKAINAETHYNASVITFTVTTEFTVDGADDQAGQALTSALAGTAGVESVEYQGGVLTVTADSREISADQIAAQLTEQTPYEVAVAAGKVEKGPETTEEVTIRVAGMTTNQDASEVSSALRFQGIVDGSLDLESSSMTVVYDPAKISGEKILEGLRFALPERDFSLASAEGAASSGGAGGLAVWLIVGAAVLVILLVAAWPLVRSRIGGGLSPERATRS